MTARKFTVPITTAADGSATAYTPYFKGAIESIQYIKTNFADGVDFTITTDVAGETVWSELNVNAAAVRRPRAATHTTAGVAALYAAGGTAVNNRIVVDRDRVKIVIAQGGNATTGSFVVTIED